MKKYEEAPDDRNRLEYCEKALQEQVLNTS